MSSSSPVFSLPGAPPQPEIEQLLPGYIARQRWFGGKSRRIRQARIASSTALPGTKAVLSTIAVHYDDGGPADLYQLPLATAAGQQAEDLQKKSPHTILTAISFSDLEAVLYDASADPTFRSALLHLIATSAKASVLPAGTGTGTSLLVGERSSSFDPEAWLKASSRVGSAEQSNTSLIYSNQEGNQAILKLFRRLRPGENPDVEIARFLTEVAHFKHIPAYFGDLHLAGPLAPDRTTLAFLQQFAPNQGDGWDWTLLELGRFYSSVAGLSAPDRGGEVPAFSLQDPVPDILREHAGAYLNAAALLGRRTGELHLALATPTTDDAFRVEAFTAADLDADRLRIGAQADAALAALKAKLASGELTSPAAELAAELCSRAGAVRARATDLSGDPTLFGQRIRIHGDFHLGQLLRSGDDFLLVDFEGEPARSMEERRRKQTPLKDVAGMLRSFSYASRAGLEAHVAGGRGNTAEQTAALLPWAALWEDSVCAEYLRGYREAATEAPALLPRAAQADALLSALLLEKALYELLYELNNRPTWLPIPLAGLLALAR